MSSLSPEPLPVSLQARVANGFTQGIRLMCPMQHWTIMAKLGRFTSRVLALAGTGDLQGLLNCFQAGCSSDFGDLLRVDNQAVRPTLTRERGRMLFQIAPDQPAGSGAGYGLTPSGPTPAATAASQGTLHMCTVGRQDEMPDHWQISPWSCYRQSYSWCCAPYSNACHCSCDPATCSPCSGDHARAMPYSRCACSCC